MLALSVAIDGTWAHDMWSDVVTLYGSHPSVSSWPHPRDHHAFFEFIKQNPLAWKEVVKEFVFPSATQVHPQVAPTANCVCQDCRKICVSAQSLAAHRFAVHRVVNPSRAFAHSTCCAACLVEFWERHRLVKHLAAQGNRCLPALMANVEPLTPAIAAALDVEAAALIRQKTSKCVHRLKASIPATRLPGPLRAWAL